MHLIKPKGRKLKWDIRFRNHDGRIEKVAGDRDQAAAARLGVRIDMLVKAKQNGDPPPVELKVWIDNMVEPLANRLIELGLLDIRRRDRDRPLMDQIDKYEKVVASRRTNDPVYAYTQAAKVRKVITLLNARTLADLTEDEVLATLQDMDRSVTTKRHYIIALKDFAKWMVKSKRARENPVEDIPLPRQHSDVTIERVPLKIQEFQKLMGYLDTFERYPKQIARWVAAERKLLYWTAVMTAYRQNELRSLRVRNLLLDAIPPQIAVRAVDTKNATAATVAIPTDLATALAVHVDGRDPEDRVFEFPSTRACIVRMFRRDLDGAGIRWNFGEDSPYTIDFHTLRATAICWWLDVKKLSPKRVQILARLKSLPLVALYSRNLQIDEYGWLNQGPSLVETGSATPQVQ